MQLLFLYTKKASFEVSGFFYALITAVVFMLPTILSGIVSWWVNYELAVTKIFFLYKLSFSVILFVMGVIELYMRFSMPDISGGVGGVSIFFITL